MKFNKSELIAARTAAGMSQETLANLIGVTPATVSYWESGRNAPRLAALNMVAKVLRCNPMQFFSPAFVASPGDTAIVTLPVRVTFSQAEEGLVMIVDPGQSIPYKGQAFIQVPASV